MFKILDKDNDKKIDPDEYVKLYENEDLVFGWFEYLNQDEGFMEEVLNQKEAIEEKEKKIENIKSSLGGAM